MNSFSFYNKTKLKYQKNVAYCNKPGDTKHSEPSWCTNAIYTSSRRRRPQSKVLPWFCSPLRMERGAEREGSSAPNASRSCPEVEGPIISPTYRHPSPQGGLLINNISDRKDGVQIPPPFEEVKWLGSHREARRIRTNSRLSHRGWEKRRRFQLQPRTSANWALMASNLALSWTARATLFLSNGSETEGLPN